MAQPGLSVTADWTPFEKQLAVLTRPGLDQAVALALVDTAVQGKAKAASAIAKHTGLKVADVKDKIFYDRVNVGDYQTYIRSTRKLIPLIDYRARQNSGGVRATKPWGEAQQFSSAFIATMPKTGHRGVFRRRGKARLPIKELWGPSIWLTFNKTEVQDIVKATIKTRIAVNLARRIKSALRKQR